MTLLNPITDVEYILLGAIIIFTVAILGFSLYKIITLYFTDRTLRSELNSISSSIEDIFKDISEDISDIYFILSDIVSKI